MKLYFALVPAALAAVTALSGCGLSAPGNTSAAAAPTPSRAAVVSTDASSGFGSVKDEGDLPNPCTLLSRSEVRKLTGRAVTQIDEDDADPGESTRYCQWQQDGGQLALFLSRTGYQDFRAQIADGESVDGVGDDAFAQAGHLYVLYGTVQLDVYSRGADDDDANLADAKDVAKAVLPKI